MCSENRQSSWLVGLASLSGYAVVTLVAFHEMIRRFGLVIPGGHDAYLFQWNLWWFNVGTWRAGQSLFWTDLQNYPVGSPLSLFPLNMTQVLWATPLSYLWGPPQAHALTVLVCFSLSGYFMFLLALRFGLGISGSFLAGLIFTLSPFHFSHAADGQVELVCLQWIPLFLLFFVAWLESRTWLSAIGLWVSFILLFYSNWYLTLYTLILTTLYCVFFPAHREFLREKLFWAQAGMILAASASAIAPLTLSAVGIAASFQLHSGHILFSADLVSFLIPGEISVWNGWTQRLWEGFTGNLSSKGSYLGVVPLVLAVLGVRRGLMEPRLKRFCLLAAALGIIFGLGPYLHIGGVYEVPIAELGPLQSPARLLASLARSLNPSWSISPGHIALPLPYLLLKEIPYFSLSRVPARFLVLTYLSLALLAGAGLSVLTGRLNRRRGLLVSGLIFVLVCVEYFPRISYRQVSIHPFFYRLRQDFADYALLDLSRLRVRLLNQTVHEKRIVGGIGENRFAPVVDYYRKVGFADLLFGQEEPNLKFALSNAKRLGIRYILVPAAQEATVATLRELGVQQEYADSRLVVFEIAGGS